DESYAERERRPRGARVLGLLVRVLLDVVRVVVGDPEGPHHGSRLRQQVDRLRDRAGEEEEQGVRAQRLGPKQPRYDRDRAVVQEVRKQEREPLEAGELREMGPENRSGTARVSVLVGVWLVVLGA